MRLWTPFCASACAISLLRGLLDKVSQRSLGRRAAAGLHTQGLRDHHDLNLQQAQTAQPRGVGFQLLPDACGHLGTLRQEVAHQLGRGGRAQQGRGFEVARPAEVLSAAPADQDAIAGRIDFAVVGQR